MVSIRTVFIVVLSFAFLTGADRADAPLLTLIDDEGSEHIFDVTSWSWKNGKGKQNALPGGENTIYFRVFGRLNFDVFRNWGISESVFPKATFATAICGGPSRFELGNVSIVATGPVGGADDSIVFVRMDFDSVRAEGDPEIIKECGG